MKKLIAVLAVLILMPSLIVGAQVDLESLPGNEQAQEILDDVPEKTQELMDQFGIDEISPESLLALSFSDFLSFLWESIKEYALSPIRRVFLIAAITVMCALLENLKSSVASESLNRVFSTVATLGVVAIIGEGALECIKETCQTVGNYNNFMLSFIPVYAGAITVAGSPATSGVYGTFMFAVCQIISTLITSTIMPLLGIYLGMSIVAGVNPKLNIGGITDGIKKSATWILTLLMTVFTGIMSIQSVIAAGSDSVAVKTGKYLLSSFVPVVGSALSEVYLSVQGCMKLLKNCIGGYCVIAVVITFLPILARLVVWKFLVFIAQIFSEVLNIKSITTLTKAVGATFSLLIAIVLVFSLLIIVSTTLMMLIGQG